jgi:hypothetical protein
MKQTNYMVDDNYEYNIDEDVESPSKAFNKKKGLSYHIKHKLIALS